PPASVLLARRLDVFCLVRPGVRFYGGAPSPADIWWTPRTMLVPLARSQDRVEIYARGKLLPSLLETGQVRIADDTGSSTLAASEIGLRFNNWDRVRADRLPLLLACAALCGAMGVILVLVATGRLAYRGEKE